MNRQPSKLARRVVLALLASTFAMSAQAALDTTARTTDHSINVPTGWWVYNNVTAAQVGSYLNINSARLTQIEVDSYIGGVPRYSVRMVKNSGAYAVSGWWWYPGLTSAQVGTFLNTNSARLIDLEPYDIGGGNIRYAAVMVSNTGTSARAWSYLSNATSTQVSSHLSASGHRLVDLDAYYIGATKRYSVVAVANTGADYKPWEWWLNQTPTSLAAKVSAYGGRIVKLDRQKDGTYNVIQVKNTSTNNSAWWYQYNFTSVAALSNFANQFAARPVNINSYLNSSGLRRYDAVFIDNANASTRRMRGIYSATFLDSTGGPTRGIFESYLKLIGGTVRVDLNSRRHAETASSLKSLHLLHAMRQVAAGTDTLSSSFVFYNYSGGKGKDSCPKPAEETAANKYPYWTFETGLDEMMVNSDNRATRGVVLRYGGFASINATAAAVGMTGTRLRHNIGCGYWNLTTSKPDPDNLRNNTTAADLARIYEGVWNSTLLSNANSARTEFLESASPSTGPGSLATIISQEAVKLGKSSSVAYQFGQAIQRWGKGGSYDDCMQLDAAGNCTKTVMTRSGAGLIRLPIKISGTVGTFYRTYAFARLVSDVPVSCASCMPKATYQSAYENANNELYRDEIRLALQTW